MTSKEHYKNIAKELKEKRPKIEDYDNLKKWKINLMRIVIEMEDNPEFEEETFLNDCGYDINLAEVENIII